MTTRTGVTSDPPKNVTRCQEAMKTLLGEKLTPNAALISSCARFSMALSFDSLLTNICI